MTVARVRSGQKGGSDQFSGIAGTSVAAESWRTWLSHMFVLFDSGSVCPVLRYRTASIADRA